ncbi:hypothetical protein [Agrobacterium pusense]|uniref:hypothetical protein n=1 Tax=Agrobacterium pusense TaxID=648995 RepID=UPI000EE98E8D|nr:hypothetical protein [Agrobacterium sp.]
MKDVLGKVATVAAFVMVISMLAACQTTEPKVITQVQVHRIEMPKNLLTCSPEPKLQDVKQDRDYKLSGKVVFRFADKLPLAGEDCRGKLFAVKRIVEGQ